MMDELPLEIPYDELMQRLNNRPLPATPNRSARNLKDFNDAYKKLRNESELYQALPEAIKDTNATIAQDYRFLTQAPQLAIAAIVNPATQNLAISKIFNMIEAADKGDTVVPKGTPPEQAMLTWEQRHNATRTEAMQWRRDNNLPVSEEEWYKSDDEGRYYPDRDSAFVAPRSDLGLIMLESDLDYLTAEQRAQYERTYNMYFAPGHESGNPYLEPTGTYYYKTWEGEEE